MGTGINYYYKKRINGFFASEVANLLIPSISHVSSDSLLVSSENEIVSHHQ